MRRRLAALFILSSAAAGCSLLVDFDRGRIPSLGELEDAAADVSIRDGQVDAPGLDGTVDAPFDSTIIDAPITVDAGDAGDAADAADARVTVDASDAGDAAFDARDAADANVAIDAADANVAADAADANVAIDAADANTADADDGSTADANDGGTADADDGATADANTSTKCSVFTNFTGQTNVAINFPTVATSGQYTPNCIRVSAGTTVTFTGNFTFHPLKRAGVALNSPIPITTVLANDAGPEGDVAVTFTGPGVFDFECGFHPSVMFGAVQVVP